MSGMTNCSKCGDHINKLADSGRYLQRTSPKGGPFIGQCAPACEYHEIKPTETSALINALNDNT